jgi:hypothetical protein
MSNVSVVTPYTGPNLGSAVAGAAVGLAAACVVGAVVGTMALARWLAEETEDERQAVKRARARQRQERLNWRPSAAISGPKGAGLDPPPRTDHLVSVALHLRQPETLVRTAEKLGYRLEPLSQPTLPLQQQPYLRLKGPAGERLAIERRPDGGLLLHTVQQPQRLQTLVRQHTLDQVVAHLQRSGMQVQTSPLVNGDLQIVAREQKPAPGGAAELRGQIGRDGTVQIDIHQVRGPRCAEIVKGIAQAMGGQVTSMTKKDAYFQLPGELTRVKERV